jgi:CspA family cold shock protein
MAAPDDGTGGRVVNGAVKSYDARRGQGLICPDKGGADISVHSNEVERAGFACLASGDRLSFDVKTDKALGRSFAVNLTRLV